MLKKVMPITAIAMALMAAPAMAQNTGHVGLAYSNNDDAEIDAWAVEGATTFAFSDAIGAQVDGSLGTIDGDGDSATAYDINGHLFYNGGAWRVGALFGAADVDTGGINPSATHWGVEGVYWLERVALGGSAIWGDGEGILVPDFEYNNYDFNADFYATENFVIGASFGVGSLDSGTSEVDTTSYGVSAEWQLSSMPVSLLAGYTHWELDDVPVESEAFTIGARWNWGGTLVERDRAGFRNTASSVVGRYFGN
jgi:hypothetical protein